VERPANRHQKVRAGTEIRIESRDRLTAPFKSVKLLAACRVMSRDFGVYVV
jgi:hypothetical protein